MPSSFATTSKPDEAHVTKMVKIPGGTMTVAEAPAAGPNYIFPMMSGAILQRLELPADLPDVPAALLVRRRQHAGPQRGTLGRRHAGVLQRRQDHHHQDEGLQVEQRRDRGRPGRRVLDEHAQGGRHLLGGLRSRDRASSPGDVTNVVANNKTDTVTFTSGRYLQLVLVHLQRAEPDHATADRVGHHLGRREAGLGRLLGRGVHVGDDPDRRQGPGRRLGRPPRLARQCYAFLTGKTEAGDLGTYATNPLWQIVDGPFRLTAYDATDGGATMVPNTAYSGPVKPSIDKLVLAPFTTDTAEFNVLSGRQHPQHRLRPAAERACLQG